jgi:nucleotide-binding universal stress UspA family protein
VIRTALVAMDGSPHGDAAATLGIEWARRFDAKLVGLGILDEPSITRPEPVSLGAAAFKHRRDERRLAHAHQHVLAFLAEFHDRCAREGVRCAAVEDVGTPHDQILREAQSCDVVIMGRESNFHRPRLLVLGTHGVTRSWTCSSQR